MIALLDVNFLVALFDPAHVHHEPAHRWFHETGTTGWASCPLTENGFVRVLSSPAYAGRGTTLEDAIARLREFEEGSDHTFWPDSLSICERSLLLPRRLGGHRKLTDVYLLALAVRNGGRLATFDRAIPLASVAGAEPRHLALVG